MNIIRRIDCLCYTTIKIKYKTINLDNKMLKLNRVDFDREHRFRKSRELRPRESEEGLVACITCDNMTGGTSDDDFPYCEHPERARKVKITEYWKCWFKGRKTHSIADRRVCDVYESRPLAEDVEIPVLSEGNGILLESQWRDILHASLECPYVIEELRMQNKGAKKQVGIGFRDISELVQDETIGHQICEMPCCDNKLPYYTWGIDDYRRKVNIQPDGSEEKPWVRRVQSHEEKVIIRPEEAEAVFDLTRFNEPMQGGIHSQICAAMDHLYDNCNRLGSKPLSEATNPVCFSPYHNILKDFIVNSKRHLEIWAYDERLIDGRSGLEVPTKSLDRIPEGFIFCVDTNGVMSWALSAHYITPRDFWIHGVVRPLEDEILQSRGLSHFIEIGAVKYHDSNAYMGVYGKGFHGLARFDEQ